MRGAVTVVLVCLAALGFNAPLLAYEETPTDATKRRDESSEEKKDESTDDSSADEQPEKTKRNYLSLNQLDAYLAFRSEYTHTKVEQDNRDRFRRLPQSSQSNEDLTFEELLGLRFDGHVLDPRLVSFGGEIAVGLSQERFEERIGADEKIDEDHGDILRYDLRADFFRGKPISGSIYGLRQDDRIARRFQPSLDQKRNGFGTNWVYSHDKVPMELSYDYQETDRTGNWDKRDDDHFTESTFHYKADWLISKKQKLTLSYDHSDIKQEYQGLRQPYETSRDLVKAEHVLNFGPLDKHELRTLLHAQEESGDFARDLFEFGPQLSLRHSETLQTRYTYQFNAENYEGLEIDTHRADFQLIHQLYENLTSTFDAFTLYEDVEEDVDTTQYGASGDWQYHKKNRWGEFRANLGLGYDTAEYDGDDGVRVVLDEAIAFRDPVSPTLRNRDVIPWSILVTDASNRRILRYGVDYFVSQVGDYTQITRIRTGLIADGDTVLVDYQYRTPTDGKTDTIRTDFNLEQRFTNGLTPYYRFSYRNQEDDPSTGFPRRADRTDHHRLGVNYDKKKYSLGAEYEIFDDTVDPYDAFHLTGGLRLLQTPEHDVGTSAKFSRFYFEGGTDDRDVTLIDLQLDHRWQMTRTWSAVERVGYRFEDDSVDGETQGWDVSSGLQYAMGDLSAEFTFEYDRLALPESEDDNFGLFVTIRREIRDVFARR